MKQKSENLRKYKAFGNMGKEMSRRNRNVDNYVEKIWITKKIKGTGVKKSGNKKISKKICEKLYFSIFAANA